MQTENLPLEPEAMSRWWSEIDAGERVRKQYEPWWEENIRQYSPEVTRDPKDYGDKVNTNRDFTLVEQKKAKLFFQTPDVTLKPAPRIASLQGGKEALSAHADVVNEYLADDQRVNASDMMDDVLFDCLCPAGFGVTKMGYENVTEEVEVAVPVPDPATGAPAVDPLSGQPVTVPQKVPVPIWEKLYWERVTPMKVVIPAGFKSTKYDNAPWLAVRFSLTLNEARLRYNLPPNFEAKAGKDEHAFDHSQTDDSDSKPVEGVEIWYRAAVYDDKVKNPDLLRVLVLIKGFDQPVKHTDSPYQEIDPQTGRISPRSLKGYPIHILTLRTLADSAYVMSDCGISRPQVNELNRFREQQVKLRDSNIPIRMVDSDRIPPEVLEKIKNAEYGSAPIPVPAEAMAGNPAIIEIAKATYPRENLVFEQKQDDDIARTHAMDSNQSGVKNESARTATELQLIQVNSNERLDKERARVLRWYVAGVTKFSTLIQRFVTVEQAAEIVGPERAQVWKTVMPSIPSGLAFTAAPDSAMRIDSAQNRKFAMELQQYFRPDPRVNQDMLLTEKVLPMVGMDSRYLAPPQPPPPPPPEPVKAQVQVKGEDLSPLLPQYVGVLLVLKAAGMDVSAMPPPAPVQQQPYPGPMSPPSGGGESKNTGGMQGTGQPAPIAPGGQGMANAE